MTEDISKAIAVVVSSCDSYFELWAPFEHLFWRFWPDCPHQVYLVSNERGYTSPRFRNLRVGEDVSWSDNLMSAVNQLHTPYILLLLDDLFLSAVVDQSALSTITKWAIASEANYVSLYSSPRPPVRTTSLVGSLPKRSCYRVSTMATLWRKSVLQSLLRPGESAWEFEIKGTIRSDEFDSFYSTVAPHFALINCVVKGRWHPAALKAVRNLGVDPDVTVRGVMTNKQVLRQRFLSLRARMFQMVPLAYRIRVKELLQGGRSCYGRLE